MITPDNQQPTDGEGQKTAREQCVPLAALAVDGTPPEIGDDVDYTVRGKIARIAEECAYVTPSTINDQPAEVETAAKEPEDGDMMAMAKRADGEMPA